MNAIPEGWERVDFGYPGDPTPAGDDEYRLDVEGRSIIVRPRNDRWSTLKSKGYWTCPICGTGGKYHRRTIQFHFDTKH